MRIPQLTTTTRAGFFSLGLFLVALSTAAQYHELNGLNAEQESGHAATAQVSMKDRNAGLCKANS